MAIPIHLQQFKAAGVYRVVFDRSSMVNTEPETLRLVVGYSEVGPFNCPVYVRDPQEFIQYFGGISKKLEKRGVYFHRMCLQMLTLSPIICLNLKKFSGETVGASTINTGFNVNFDPIDDVKVNLEDIFDKTRFWELSAEQLNDLNTVEGLTLNNYINLSMTDTYANSASYFIRKASGSKVSQYNVTVNDWYSDNLDEKPDYLEDYGNLLISDFFAEIYVFKGKFRSSQILASDTLKKYFVSTSEEDESENNSFGTKNYILKLRSDLRNPYDELIDPLDALYADPTSNAIGHWVGCLIPYFKDKRGNYQSLDIVFNQDQDEHKMMMSFNIDLLEEYNAAPIDLSGKLAIPVSSKLSKRSITNGANVYYFNNPLSLETIYQGVAKTNLLGNLAAPVIADRINYYSSLDNNLRAFKVPELTSKKSYITGTLYVSDVQPCVSVDLNTNDDSTVNPAQPVQPLNPGDPVDINDTDNGSTVNVEDTTPTYIVILRQVRPTPGEQETVKIYCTADRLNYVLKSCGVTNYMCDINNEYKNNYILWYDAENDVYTYNENWKDNIQHAPMAGTWWYYEGNGETDPDPEAPWDTNFEPFSEEHPFWGPSKVITSIRRLEQYNEQTDNTATYIDIDVNFVCSFNSVNILTNTRGTIQDNVKESIYGSSMSFIEVSSWYFKEDLSIDGGLYTALVTDRKYDSSLQLVLKKGDCLLASDGTIDKNHDGELTPEDEDYFYDNVWVQEQGTLYNENGEFKCHYILVSGAPLGFDENKLDTVEEGGWSYSADQDYTNTDEKWSWNDDSDEFKNENDYDESGNFLPKYIVRVDAPLNQEIGVMKPHYLEGYTYKNARPNGTDMWAKLQWQKSIFSALSDYKGLRTGLLNKADIDYRYVIDTFESFPQTELKSELSLLCKEKESAFCIANLPSIRTFVKCPYTSFTDANGIFNSKYVVAGRNRKKPSSEIFSLPTEVDGASFIGFYTPLKFTDGYVDTIVPSAGLVSNLFIQKYMSRQPYYIVAGPTYGAITANGLVGPDYKFSREELYDLEPYGFNCMVYRPSFGTFINANQTAKQTPLSALSRINVRELVIYLQDEIEKVLQAYQWEFNNQTTRNAILDRANQICAIIKANGGIQAYFNIMDESNNTNEIIDNEMAVLSTHIEPGFGCGKMVHELTLYRTGQMSSFITESN